MSILYPMFSLALITFIIGPLLLVTRINSVKAGIVPMEYYEIFQGGQPPANVIQTTRHWSNLFEAPTLFYVVCILAILLQVDSLLLTGMAWAYVSIRVLHSLVHLTYNRVSHRLSMFLTSQVILITMWIIVFMEII